MKTTREIHEQDQAEALIVQRFEQHMALLEQQHLEAQRKIERDHRRMLVFIAIIMVVALFGPLVVVWWRAHR